jgi:hypothetical protein
MTPLLVKIIFGILTAAVTWLFRHPTGRVARRMFSLHGPRTDVAAMNRQELFQSGRWFFGIGVLLLAAYAASVFLAGNAIAESAPLLFLLFFLSFPGLMGIGGGLYLFVRGLARPSAPEAGDSRSPITPR